LLFEINEFGIPGVNFNNVNKLQVTNPPFPGPTILCTPVVICRCVESRGANTIEGQDVYKFVGLLFSEKKFVPVEGKEVGAKLSCKSMRVLSLVICVALYRMQVLSQK